MLEHLLVNGTPQVRQYRPPPSVYLDHWAFRRFSEKALRDELASAIAERNGTLAVGRLHLALSPCYLAGPIPELRRISSPAGELQGELWIVTHKALKDTARIRACLTIIGDGTASMRSLFEGRRTAIAK